MLILSPIKGVLKTFYIYFLKTYNLNDTYNNHLIFMKDVGEILLNHYFPTNYNSDKREYEYSFNDFSELEIITTLNINRNSSNKYNKYNISVEVRSHIFPTKYIHSLYKNRSIKYKDTNHSIGIAIKSLNKYEYNYMFIFPEEYYEIALNIIKENYDNKIRRESIT